MKRLGLKKLIFSFVVIDIFGICKYSLANHDLNHKTLVFNNEMFSNNLPYNMNSNDLDNQGFSIKESKFNNDFKLIKNVQMHSKKSEMQKNTKVIINTLNKENLNNKFKSTFKDLSSTFSSNYGSPVERAPDESLKTCTTKACYE